MTGEHNGRDDGRRDSELSGDRPTARTPVAQRVMEKLVTDGGFEAGFFSAVVEKVGVGVGVYESDGRFAFVNQAYADLLGMDRERLQSAAVWDVNPALEESRFTEYWGSSDVGETRQRETVHTQSDGSAIPVETHTTAIEVDGTRYHVGTIADISERVEGWEQLERQDERLEQFASVVSHDLRNPLNVAMGRLQLAQEMTDSEHLEHVERSLQRMESLIEDVLTMARDGNRIKEPEPVDLERIVHKAWRTTGSDDGHLEIEGDLGTVQSDEKRLLEVFENLFENAVTHGSIDVTVRIGLTDDGIFIADDGPGIPQGEMEDVMEYGYTTTERGTGFGLTIVEQIVTAHGWSVSLTESNRGGARVEFADIAFE